MIKNIEYIAEDGTVFDNEQTCLDHEAITTACQNLIVMDKFHRRITTGEEISDYGIYHLVRNEADIELLNKISDYHGGCVPNKVGYFMYDEDIDDFVSIDEVIENLEEIKRKLNRIEERMEGLVD